MLSLLLAFALAGDSIACTTFCARGVFGRNYDFETGEGMLFVNKRGLRKTALTSQQPASWVSQYGSVTFNQFGREFPMDGMNEAGLVVALMWLEGTRYPDADARPTVGVLEWIQFQLDTAATVEEVLANCSRVRIRQGATPLHYLVADSRGDAATIEFLGGQLVVHRGDSLPVAVLTNDTYASSFDWLSRLRREKRTPSSVSSLDRFARAAMLLEAPSSDPVATALSILAAVAQPGSTRWSVAYDISNHTLHYQSQLNRARRSVDLRSLDFSCATPSQMLALDAGSGEVGGLFVPYSYEANRALIAASYAHTSFLRGTTSEALDETARHPESARCSTSPRRRAVR